MHIPRFGNGFKSTHDQTAHFLFVIDVAIGVSHHGPHRMNALNFVGYDVEVFCRIQGHIHTGQLTKLTGPLPCTIHQNVTLDVALFGFDSFHAAFV